jgi:hypothetical protein
MASALTGCKPQSIRRLEGEGIIIPVLSMRAVPGGATGTKQAKTTPA